MEVIDQNGCVLFQPRAISAEDNTSLGSGEAGPGAFNLVDENGTLSIVNCYYNVGGVIKQAADMLVGAVTDCILAFSMTSQAIMVYSTLAQLQEAQRNADDYVVGLYVIDGAGKVSVDLRTAPQIQYFEEGLS